MSVCPTCGTTFENLGSHLSHPSVDCSLPKLESNLKKVLTGVMMGDGYLNTSGKSPNVVIEMINKNYLEYLNGTLGIYAVPSGVFCKRTGEEQANLAISCNPDSNIVKENYNDLYCLSTRSSPVFNFFLDWYESGKKIFPENIELSPTVLKHWFVCDGDYDTSGRNDRLRISMTNEKEYREKNRVNVQ